MFLNFFKGFLMGIANVIPGVSGGTFAFVLGVLDRILAAINAVHAKTFQILLHPKSWFSSTGRITLQEELKRIDALFLATLITGAVCAILSGAHVMHKGLNEYPQYMLSLFIGLIIPSIGVPVGEMPTKKWYHLPLLILGIFVVVEVGNLFSSKMEAEAGFTLVFFGGMIAFVAMILPGISGSFMLLVMGLYTPLMMHIKGLTSFNLGIRAWAQALPEHLLWLTVVGTGGLVGAKGFAKIMTFLLDKYRSATLSFLIGLLLGSFWVLWPLKDIEQGAKVYNRKGEIKRDIQILTAPNRLPSFPEDTQNTMICLACLVLGLFGGAGVNRLGKTSEKNLKTEETTSHG